jgi:hypothetical protein
VRKRKKARQPPAVKAAGADVDDRQARHSRLLVWQTAP